MTEDQKHQLAAAMCLTWRHDYGLQRQPGDPLSSGTTQTEREYLHRKMLDLIEHHWPRLRTEEWELCLKPVGAKEKTE